MKMTDFLLARIAEDEAAAICSHGRDCSNRDFSYAPGLMDCNEMQSDPRRWLAECEAKRQIVALHDAAHYCADGTLHAPVAPPMFAGGDECHGTCPTLRAIAAVYDDHLDYDPEWGDA